MISFYVLRVAVISSANFGLRDYVAEMGIYISRTHNEGTEGWSVHCVGWQ